jgi:predicted phage tail protein
MLRVIKVYGSLAKFLGQRSFEAAVRTPAEAVRFLVANFPGVESHMSERHYKVSVGRHELTAGDQPEQLHYPAGDLEPIRIVPVLAGAGAVGRIIAGAALVAAAIFIPGLGLGLAGATVTQIGVLGGALILGGIAQLITPVPQIGGGKDSDKDPRKSYSFSGIQNVSRQGIPVPIVYGETLIGSIVVSAGINTEKVPI